MGSRSIQSQQPDRVRARPSAASAKRNSAGDALVLRSPAQFKALGHPVRHQIVNALRQRPATLRQIADGLALPKGTVSHHIHVLRDAGLVKVAEGRQVRGGTEQLLALRSREMRLDAPTVDGARFLVESALAEMVVPQAPQPEHTVLRHLWLTHRQAAVLAAELEAYAVTDESPHDESARPYGLLLSLFPASIPKLLPAEA